MTKQPKPVYLRQEGNSFFVCHFNPKAHQRRFAAQFSADGRDWEWMKAWVRAKPELLLVCAESGKPI